MKFKSLYDKTFTKKELEKLGFEPIGLYMGPKDEFELYSNGDHWMYLREFDGVFKILAKGRGLKI